MAAISNNGYALKYASKDLKSDKEVAIAAVSNNGSVLEYITSPKEIPSQKGEHY